MQLLSAAATPTASRHPLDSLSEDELAAAIAILRTQRDFDARFRFVSVELHEPAKPLVLTCHSGDPIEREAFVILIDPATRASIEAIVSVTSAAIVSWKIVDEPGQPPFMLDDFVDPLAARFWKISNREKRNALGEPMAYKLVPGENILPFAHPESSVMQRAAFARHHLWVTRYAQAERYAAGNYPNQHPGGAGLPAWTEANRSIVDTDVVVWYTMGAHHIVRPEDWPVMPTAYISFALKPSGFFNANPAFDVPAALRHHDPCCEP